MVELLIDIFIWAMIAASILSIGAVIVLSETFLGLLEFVRGILGLTLPIAVDKFLRPKSPRNRR